MPASGAQQAYLLKKRKPKLYKKALEIKKKYGLKWVDAIPIAKGLKEPPQRIEDKLSVAERKVEAIEGKLISLKKEVMSKLEELVEVKNWLECSLDTRQCVHRDKEGFCTNWFWRSPVKGWMMREDKILLEGKKTQVYRLNILKHKLHCVACRSYTTKEEKDISGRLSLLEKKVEVIDKCASKKLREIGEGYEKLRVVLEQAMHRPIQ